MTREDRWIVSLDEIQALRWQCGKCHAAVSYQLDETLSLPRSCPACQADAFDAEFNPEHRPFAQFVQGLKGILRFQKQHPNSGKLDLEFMNGSATRR